MRKGGGAGERRKGQSTNVVLSLVHVLTESGNS